jgi:hypothetical protein
MNEIRATGAAARPLRAAGRQVHRPPTRAARGARLGSFAPRGIPPGSGLRFHAFGPSGPLGRYLPGRGCRRDRGRWVSMASSPRSGARLRNSGLDGAHGLRHPRGPAVHEPSVETRVFPGVPDRVVIPDPNGAAIETTQAFSHDHSGGRRLRGIDYELPIASAQVKTAVLFAACTPTASPG